MKGREVKGEGEYVSSFKCYGALFAVDILHPAEHQSTGGNEPSANEPSANEFVYTPVHL